MIKELMYRTYVTLNISTSSVRLLSVKGREVEKWESMPLSPGLVRDGFILQPKVVGTVINALFEAAGVSKERVITSVTGLPFTYRILSLPRMKSAAQHEAVQRAAQREMQLSLEELHLSWQAIDGGSDEQDFFVLGVPRKILDTMAQTLKEAGIKPYVMDIKPLALARAAKRRDAILMNLESDCFDIVLIVNGIPSMMHTVVPRTKGAVIEDNIGRITDELAKTVEFYNTSHPNNPISSTTPLLLTGELSADTKTHGLLQNATGYSVEQLLPPFQLPPDLSCALFSINIGLALKKTSLKTVTKGNEYLFKDINVNLLLGIYGVKAVIIKQTNIILTAVLLIGIGLLYPAYQFRSQAAAETIHLQTNLIGTQQEMDKRTLATNESRQVEKNINEILSRVESQKEEQQNILSIGGEFTSSLTLANDVLPDEAYFTSVKIGSDHITVEGEADNSFTVVNYVVALEKTGKFSEVRIAWINDSKSIAAETAEAESTGVSFNIVINK
ncbi:pilus assembly protein PilM [Chloroflexota bacterium]